MISKIQNELTTYFRKTIHNRIKLKNDENDASTTISSKHKYILKSLTILNQLKQATKSYLKKSFESKSSQLSRDSARVSESFQKRISHIANQKLNNNVVKNFAQIENIETILLVSSFFSSSLTDRENDTQTKTSNSDVAKINNDIAVKRVMKEVVNKSKSQISRF